MYPAARRCHRLHHVPAAVPWTPARALTVGLASLAAGALSDLYGPRAIFTLMTAMVGLALALMPAVRSQHPGTGS